MVIQAVVKKNDFNKISYLLHFFARAFLIAVFILLLSLLIFLMVYFGDLLYNEKIGNNKVPLLGAYVIVSPSMVPTIKINDAIVIKRVEADELGIGDIITFSSNDPSYKGLTVTHRIVGKQVIQSGEFVYRTKGDNNSVEDSALVSINDIYGKVVLKLPKLGYVQKFITTPFGFIISILIPIGMVIVVDIIKIVKLLRKRNEELEVI